MLGDIMSKPLTSPFFEPVGDNRLQGIVNNLTRIESI